MYKGQFAFIALMLVVLAVLPVADATEESVNYCINTTHRYWEKNIYYNGTVYPWNDTMNCSYGCLNGLCMPAPSESHDIAIVIGVMAVAFFFMMAGLEMDKETHGVIQILFLFVGVLFVIITFAVLSELADYSSIAPLEAAIDNGFQMAIYVFWFLLFYFIALFFYKVLVSTGKIQPIGWSL